MGSLAIRTKGGVSHQQTDIELLQTGDMSDFAITCGGRTWACHGAILGSRSLWFKTVIYNTFKEIKDRKISFPTHDADCIDLMLRHIYGEDVIPVIATDTPNNESVPTMFIEMLSLADYFQLTTLQTTLIEALSVYLDEKALTFSSDWKAHGASYPTCIHDILHALTAAYDLDGCEPGRRALLAFLWVTRHEVLELACVQAVLEAEPAINKDLLLLMSRGGKTDTHWLTGMGDVSKLEHMIHNTKNRPDPSPDGNYVCEHCEEEYANNTPQHYNPFPFYVYDKLKRVGEVSWCQLCADKMIEEGTFPWRGEWPEDRPGVDSAGSPEWSF